MRDAGFNVPRFVDEQAVAELHIARSRNLLVSTFPPGQLCGICSCRIFPTRSTIVSVRLLEKNRLLVALLPKTTLKIREKDWGAEEEEQALENRRREKIVYIKTLCRKM